MGNSTSKQNTETAVQKNASETDTEQNSDPRSPTPEIARTPMQGKPGAKHNITKNVDLRKTFENAKGDEKLVHNNPILSAVIKNHLRSYDPRSPNHDFDRTPIIIASKTEELSYDDEVYNKLYSKRQLDGSISESINEDEENASEILVPKNLCNGFFNITLEEMPTELEEPLVSSTVCQDTTENKFDRIEDITEPTELLETNFDYIDSDGNEQKSLEQIEFETNTLHDTPLYSKFKILENDPRSPTCGIERTPIVVSKIDKKDSAELSTNNVEEMSDDSLIKVLQNTNAEFRQTLTKANKKSNEGLLVYEDDSSKCNVATPKKSKSASNSGSRTPLSCMKNKPESGHARSKSTNTLFDPKQKNVSKIPKRVSNIPRLQTLPKALKIVPIANSISLKNISKPCQPIGDCENTPPHSHRDRWDKDNSIVL